MIANQLDTRVALKIHLNLHLNISSFDIQLDGLFCSELILLIHDLVPRNRPKSITLISGLNEQVIRAYLLVFTFCKDYVGVMHFQR